MALKVVDKILELAGQPKTIWSTSDWTRESHCPPELDTQADGWSCGLFVLMAVRVVIKGGLSFEQAGDQYKNELRRDAVWALLRIP